MISDINHLTEKYQEPGMVHWCVLEKLTVSEGLCQSVQAASIPHTKWYPTTSSPTHRPQLVTAIVAYAFFELFQDESGFFRGSRETEGQSLKGVA